MIKDGLGYLKISLLTHEVKGSFQLG